MQQHFLQSSAWEKYQKLEDHKTFRITNSDFDLMAVLETTPLGNYLYCPYGPILKTADSLPKTTKVLKQLAQEQNAFFIRIEPLLSQAKNKSSFALPPAKLTQLGFKKSHDINPKHTWMIDLTQPESDLLDQINKEHRRLWRIRERKGISIRQTKNPTEISILVNFLNQVSSQNKFTPQNQKHLENQLKSGFATLYIADLTDESGSQKPIAAALVYDWKGTRFYAHAAADSAYRKLSAGATLLIQMILDAKNSGSKLFDFWGITTSENPNHPWHGFTKFKKSFGGYQVDYSGTWDLPLQKSRYQAYQIIRKINRLSRKILH